jgi:DNA-binding transcriptional LysR family regulator
MIYTHGSKIDANLLMILDALLHTSSVTAAAHRVGLSQSAVSHALARLRDQLGDPLMVRVGRRMVLTPKALSLAPRVHRVVGDIERIFMADAPLEPAGLRRTFHVHIPEPVLFVMGMDLDAALGAHAPLVDLYTCSATGHVLDELRNGSIDLAVDVFPDLLPELDAQTLFTDPQVCVVRSDHPALASEPGHEPELSIEQFATLPHLMVTSPGLPCVETRDLVDDLLAEHGLTRRVARVVSHSLLACFMVACTDYVAIMPERLIARMASHLGLRILEPPLAIPPHTLSLAWHQRNTADPAHRWLRSLIASVASPAATMGNQNL